MNLPKNTVDFITFMERIWEMRAAPASDGNTALAQHPAYDRFENAIKTARFCGMKRTGASTVGDKPGQVFRFPSEMHTGVCIASDGGALRPARSYGPKRAKGLVTP
jgi:hypothetical protein